jgi:hypothetical protein
MHLLKLEHSPADYPRRQWLLSIAEHRMRTQSLIESSDRLRQQLSSVLPRARRNARKLAAKGLAIDGIDARDLPLALPYTLDQLLDDDWLPPSVGSEEVA